MAVFAKYDGIDGESKDQNHDKWIDVLNLDWGIHKPGGGATGQSRRRGAAVVEDLTLTIEFEKTKNRPRIQLVANLNHAADDATVQRLGNRLGLF